MTVHCALFCAVAAAAAALVAVGAPTPVMALTVTCVELAADVFNVVIWSVAEMIAVELTIAELLIVTTPPDETVPTAVFDEAKDSPDPGSAWVDPSL
jgi:hypothetical protein